MSPIRVLIVEDSEDDTEFDVDALRSGGFDIQWRRVENEPGYLAALDWSPQIILSDCTMPEFSAKRALDLLRARGVDIPFVVVSGTIGEDIAVELMRAGAQDCVPKTNLARLAPVVKRELREAQARHAEREARARLVESELRYRRIVETAQEGVCVIDAEGGVTFVNGKMAEMLGYSVEEITGRSIFGFMDEADRPAARRDIERGRRGSRGRHDLRFCRRDGSPIWTLSSISPIFERNHVYAGALAMVTDITQRKAAEDAVRRHERLLQSILDTLPVGVWVADADGQIVAVNPAARALWGGARMVGIEQYGEYRGWRHGSGEPIKAEDWALARAIRRGETSLNEAVEIECFDGTRRIILNSAVPIRDDAQQVIGAISVSEDITESKRAEQALREREAHLRAIIDTEPECVKLLDAEGRIVQINPAGLAMLDANSAKEVIGRPVLSLIAPEYRERVEALNRGALRGDSGKLEYEIVGLKGRRCWLETHVVPLATSHGRVLLAVARDISERMLAERRLEYLAHHDTLTGLPNRALFLDRLQGAIIDAERRGRYVAVVILDVLRFSAVNASIGHERGDQLLRAVGERLAGATRKGDTTARLGADEFALLLADVGKPEDMSRVIQKILDVFEPSFPVDGREMRLSAVMGVALFPDDERTAAGLVRAAEIAHRRVKDEATNPFRFYSAGMSEHAEATLRLEHDLRRALEREEFFLHYQPVVDARARRVTEVEALVRWRHRERGLVLPLEFIPLAEQTGLIVPIGTWVLREACRQAQAWRAGGWRDLRIAVNVSAVQFARANFVDMVRAVLAETGLEPRALALELTESTLMPGSSDVDDELDALRTLGLSLSLDDFGTGYSSFSYLKRWPIDTLKIDRSFVSDVPESDHGNAVADAMIKMARSLGKRVIAEGVETEAQFMFMKSRGATAMQGFLFGAPMEAARLGRRFSDRAGK